MESFFILRNISKPEKIIAENNGFNKYAFILGPVWGIFKGLWFEGLVWFWLINFAIYIMPQMSFLFILTSSIFWGFSGKIFIFKNCLILILFLRILSYLNAQKKQFYSSHQKINEPFNYHRLWLWKY